jgi:putative transposase
LKQAEDGSAVAEVCRKAGISEATFYNWREKYAGLMPSEMKRLRQLEEENTKLKRIVADLSLDKAMLQEFSQKSFEAWPQAGACRRGARRLEGLDQAGLRLQVEARRSGCSQASDQGHL